MAIRAMQFFDRETPKGPDTHPIRENYANDERPRVRASIAKRPRLQLHCAVGVTEPNRSIMGLIGTHRASPEPAVT